MLQVAHFTAYLSLSTVWCRSAGMATQALPSFSPGQDGPEGGTDGFENGTEQPADHLRYTDLFLPAHAVSLALHMTSKRSCKALGECTLRHERHHIWPSYSHTDQEAPQTAGCYSTAMQLFSDRSACLGLLA